MKVVCAWCGKAIGEKDGKGVEGVSHSVCERCLGKLQTEMGDGIGAKSKQEENKSRQSL